mmetsp:Transcript_32710/g.76695  ORF Transcript_32710/g.76695 Transcript_32710/m.76695 type:complete len:204 (+) Transcript_32710:459-1070(+)
MLSHKSMYSKKLRLHADTRSTGTEDAVLVLAVPKCHTEIGSFSSVTNTHGLTAMSLEYTSIWLANSTEGLECCALPVNFADASERSSDMLFSFLHVHILVYFSIATFMSKSEASASLRACCKVRGTTCPQTCWTSRMTCSTLSTFQSCGTWAALTWKPRRSMYPSRMGKRLKALKVLAVDTSRLGADTAGDRGEPSSEPSCGG